MLISILALLLLNPQISAAGRPGGYECESPYADPYETRTGGLRWTMNGEPRSEAEARERVRYSCRDALGWQDPFGLACKRAAAAAACRPVEMLYCSGYASVVDRWGRRPQPSRELVRLAAVYVPSGSGESAAARVRAAYPEYCAYAQARNLFGVVPANGAENFCEETLQSLRCD